MKEYKLNKTKKETTTPNDEVINKHKNFDNLRMQYDEVVKPPRKPLYKNRKLFLLLLLIAVLAWVVAIAIEEEEKNKKEEEKQKTEAFHSAESNFLNSSSGST